uniref:X-box-binding protein 1 n=1 Tax=Ciona savignyi TaxID=51511 RepID=H2YH37_CIOSA
MSPTATPQTVIISPSTKLIPVTMANQRRTEVEFVGSPQSIPKYALGLFDSNGNGPRKRKRLTHLTNEEKVMRRKLKNRVAAQTARDRKKVRMECLEETIQKVQQQAKELLDVNMQLLERAEALEKENLELRVRLGISSSHDTTVSNNRDNVERIKVEFNDVINSHQSSEVILPECILSPDESSDEFDHRMDYKRRMCEPRHEETAKRLCLAKTECASPAPAVFGEHKLERLNPQQQEAVNLMLIHSELAQAKLPAKSSMTKPHLQKMISLDGLNKSVMNLSTKSRNAPKTQTPLDLRTNVKEQ